MRGTRLSARMRRSSMQVAGTDANRRDILDGAFEDGILVAGMAVISWGKFLGHQRWPRTRMTSRQQMRCAGEPGGAARQLVPGRAYVDLRPGAFIAPGVEEGEPAGIVKKSLTNPKQIERSPANANPAWLLISRVSGRDGRMTSREFLMKALPVLSFVAGTFA